MILSKTNELQLEWKCPACGLRESISVGSGKGLKERLDALAIFHKQERPDCPADPRILDPLSDDPEPAVRVCELDLAQWAVVNESKVLAYDLTYSGAVEAIGQNSGSGLTIVTNTVAGRMMEKSH